MRSGRRCRRRWQRWRRRCELNRCMSCESALRVAVVGCGAVAELAHLPALAKLPEVRVTVLVDPNRERRERLARQFNVEHTSAELAGRFDLFEAAIVAVPHALHAPIGVQLLARGKAVLLEKPMATSVAECEMLLRAAEQSGALLAVGLMRRFYRAHQFVRRLLIEGALGKIRTFDFQEGFIYNWPVASDFFFRKETAGGGVLMDTGAHTLDCLLHWLGDFAEVEYRDDARGGVEANCLLKLRLQNGATGTVELSRTRQLRNTAIIAGERGSVEVSLGGNHLKWIVGEPPLQLAGTVEPPGRNPPTQGYIEVITEQMQDFVAAVREGRAPAVDGRSGMAAIRLIEACYRQRQPWVFPWEEAAIEPARAVA